MLVFFIHGVATSSTKYASDLENLIRNEFIERRQPLPSFLTLFVFLRHL